MSTECIKQYVQVIHYAVLILTPPRGMDPRPDLANYHQCSKHWRWSASSPDLPSLRLPVFKDQSITHAE